MLPNILTLIRLFLAPIVIYEVHVHAYGWALWLFVIAGLTDGLDGWIAKRYHSQTQLGAFLDPLADKCLLVGLVVTLGLIEAVPMWLVMMVVFRDLVIVGGVIVIHLVSDALRMEPLMLSKINTCAQLVWVSATLLRLATGKEWDMLNDILTWIVAITTTGSGLQYVFVWWRRLSQEDAVR